MFRSGIVRIVGSKTEQIQLVCDWSFLLSRLQPGGRLFVFEHRLQGGAPSWSLLEKRVVTEICVRVGFAGDERAPPLAPRESPRRRSKRKEVVDGCSREGEKRKEKKN